MGKNIQILLVVALLAAHFILGLGVIKASSPTYDEAVHLTAGYSYLTANDYRYNPEHPPLAKMWAALPLLFMNPALHVHHPYWADIRANQYPFADLFIYHNRVDPEKMLNAGRTMILLLSCALGLLIFIFSREMFGPLSGLLALALWCFFPGALANGTLVTTDTALSLFYLLTVYAFKKLFDAAETGKKSGWARIVFFGLSAGLLFSSKYSAAAAVPALAAPLLYLYLKNKPAGVKMARSILPAAAAGFLVLLLVYRFNDIGMYYFAGIRKILEGVQSGRSSFLLGKYSTEGWLYYFPVTFLLKTPLPLLALIAAAPFFKRTRSKDAVLFLLAPAAVFFIMSCFSKMQIGHRHILPVYPFLIVWVSGLASPAAGKYFKYLAAAAVILAAALSVKVHPWYLSYFNEIVPSQDDGYKYLTDSNLDWGQGLKALGSYLKTEGAGGIYLCYFGTADPAYYGISYIPIGFIDGISPPYTENERTGDKFDPARQDKVLMAISATNLQATYYADKNIFSFLKDLKPKKIIAHSIFVYDLTANPQAYSKIKSITGQN